MIRFFRERPALQGLLLIAPTMFWMLLFLLVPLALIVVMSFGLRGTYGNVLYVFQWSNYLRLVDPEYASILWQSVWIAALTTTFCLLAGYPLAYAIARAAARRRPVLVFLILVPFWTNFLIRIYAWMIILRGEGVLGGVLSALGLMHGVGLWLFQRVQLYTPGAVLLAMVYEFLPYMILPLYSSLEKLDLALLEAAADLGARPWRAFLRVTLPLSVPGIIAGSILVFIPAMGMFVVPDLMGGAKTLLVGNLIRNQFLVARDWPFGAAASMVLMALTLAVTRFYTKVSGFGVELTP